jgi:Subtilase family
MALGAKASLPSLTPGPSANVYVIPQNAEQSLRGALSIQTDAAWEQQLQAWGALTVNSLDRDAFFALMQRGAVVVDDVVVGSGTKVVAAQPIQPAGPKPPGFLPADFTGPYDWHIDHRGVNAVQAWQMFAAQPKFANALPWAGIRVAHIDTGYTEHAALGWSGGSSPTVRPQLGNDYWDGAHDPDPRDMWLPGFPGHGTRISAAIAGYYPNAAGGPFFGVAPGAQIVPYRVTDSVIVDHVPKNIAAAIRAAVQSQCHVINISLGALRGDKHIAAALDEAYESGVIVACAAGQVWGEVIYPGRFNRCITMGGVGPGFQPWKSAAKGKFVDICGPAAAIRRIKAENLTPGTAAQGMHPKADGDGTSYATAACSGAAVLWLAWHGVAALHAKYATSGKWQIPKAFKKLLKAHATPGAWGPEEANNYGSGVLNIAATLQAALPADGSMTPASKAYAPFDPND